MSAEQFPPMLEVVHRCQYCGQEMMEIPALSYEENPFCSKCLPERIAKAGKGFLGWAILGDYAYPIWESTR